MNQNIPLRKIPKKTLFYIVILIIVGILSIFILDYGKTKKATRILNKLDYHNIKNVTVFSKTQFLNKDTNTKGYQYSLKFLDLNTNKKCRGFIARDFKGNVAQDLECK
ncbi:hypothetical protein MNB_ARC-1_434 [hydrothermal vent metagenome]|uniref:Uncharacterized protein n=1 Tax=hydrothermal vent metagenome TaxID=652676 RepID=A0A3B1E9B1_9ZZZZ